MLESAWQIATAYDCTVYDSLYVALAVIKNGQLTTAYRALYNRLKTTPLKKSLVWIENIPK